MAENSTDGSPDEIVLDVVVPAYNEAERLPGTLTRLRAAMAGLGVPCQVTVVDNASTDTTVEVVRGAPAGPVPVRLLSCARRGKGYAVRTGVLASTGRYVGFCDADLATAPDTLAYVLSLLVAGADAVIGSRAHPQSTVQERHSPVRRWGAALFRGAVRSVVRGVSETQCGFKFFRAEVARQAFEPLGCGGFAFDVEVLGRAERAGARLVEIPVQWVDVPGSRFSPLRHGWRSFLDVLAIRRRLRTVDASITVPVPRSAGAPEAAVPVVSGRVYP